MARNAKGTPISYPAIVLWSQKKAKKGGQIYFGEPHPFMITAW